MARKSHLLMWTVKRKRKEGRGTGGSFFFFFFFLLADINGREMAENLFG